MPRTTETTFIAAVLAFAAAAAVATPAAAQDHSGHGGGGTMHGGPAAAPGQLYAGLADRPIKALSAERTEGLLAGKGIGYALAAELNHYPGPRHALDSAETLGLSEVQLERVQSLFDDMRARAIALGAEIVAAERALDTMFASREIDSASLRAKVAEIAGLEGELRFTHLATHLEMRAILTPHQVMLYDRMRGYAPVHQ